MYQNSKRITSYVIPFLLSLFISSNSYAQVILKEVEPSDKIVPKTEKRTFKTHRNYPQNPAIQMNSTSVGNLGFDPGFFAIAPNSITPISQVEPYSHLSSVINFAGEAEANAVLEVVITDDATNTIVFDENDDLPVIPSATILEVASTDYFTPNGDIPSSYSATYRIVTDNPDTDTSNNTLNYSMETSDTTFSKDFGGDFSVRPADGNWGDGEPHSWAYGNFYHIVDGENWEASSVTFGIGNTNNSDLEDELIGVYLYRWIDDFNQNGDMDPDERERVGLNVYVIQGTETNDELITLELLDFSTGDPGVELMSDEDYVVMVEYVTFEDFSNFEILAGTADYVGMTARSQVDAANRYASLIGIGFPDDATFFTSGFAGLVPVVRLNIAPAQGAANITDLACSGECTGAIDLLINGGEPNSGYEWTGPDGFSANTEDISNLCAGTYQVTITDFEGNTSSEVFEVEEPGLLTGMTSFENSSCFQSCDGTAMIFADGGVAPYDYNWSDGSAGEIISDLCADTYTVTITDANGCTHTSSIQIAEPQEIILGFEISLVPCTFPCESSIAVNITNGTAPYSFEWFDSFGSFLSTNDELNNVCPGVYTVIITDADGCTIEAFPEIVDPDFPVATGSIQNVSCFENCDGEIDLAINGGVTPYTFEWSDGLPGQEDQTDICAGTYTVTITDDSGCANLLFIEITEPSALNVSIVSLTNPSCFEECDGMIDLSVSGGTAPYTYNGSSTEDLCAGNYSITVTDAAECMSVLNFIIDETPMLEVSIDTIGDEVDGMMSGFVDITLSNGTPPYSYSWTNNNVVVSTDEDPSGLAAGTYEVEITDAAGCVIILSDIVVDNILDVDQFELDNSIQIFPNPTSGLLQVKFDLTMSQTIDIEVYDITGRLLRSSNHLNVLNDILSIDMNTFSDGVYALKINWKDGFEVEKIVKY